MCRITVGTDIVKTEIVLERGARGYTNLKFCLSFTPPSSSDSNKNSN
jgi:hypothetical protein